MTYQISHRMAMMRFHFSLVLLGFILLVSSSVSAQTHSAYCSDAESTAATQTCLKKHLDNAQARLNTVYDKLSVQLDADKKAELAELQKTWLAYRDAECSWEAQSLDNSALKYINELSCMARLTEDRADILTTIGEDTLNSGVTREYGSFPRWMNVVAKENPEVYWDYGSRQGMDLNCDNKNEYIMVGRHHKLIESHSEGDDESKRQSSFSSELVISIAQNPSVGRPEATIFKFNETVGSGADILCNDNIDFSIVPHEASNEISEDENAEEEICLSRLQILAKGCEAHYVEWTGKDFELVQPALEDDKPSVE